MCASVDILSKYFLQKLIKPVHFGGFNLIRCRFPSFMCDLLKNPVISTLVSKSHINSTQIASHQEELRREERFTDQKYLSISFLQTDCINIDSSSGCGRNSERANTVQTKYNFCGGSNHSAEKNPKGSDKKRKHFVRMVIRTTDVQNVQLANFLYVDLKIT